jgi:hypothetical protein
MSKRTPYSKENSVSSYFQTLLIFPVFPTFSTWPSFYCVLYKKLVAAGLVPEPAGQVPEAREPAPPVRLQPRPDLHPPILTPAGQPPRPPPAGQRRPPRRTEPGPLRQPADRSRRHLVSHAISLNRLFRSILSFGLSGLYDFSCCFFVLHVLAHHA